MATWNALRLPDFIQNKCLSTQQVVAMDAPLSRPPPLQPMRTVKRNPFPAKLLKIKAPEMSTTRRASRHLCGMQLFDLAGRGNRLVSSHISTLDSFGSLRRTRSERKQDWDMVKNLLQDEHRTTQYDMFDEAQGIVRIPILPGILLREDSSLPIALDGLPMMLLISPPKKISVLSIESNMCFDLEFLLGVVSEDTRSPSMYYLSESTYVPKLFHESKQDTAERLMDHRLWEMGIEFPVVRSPVIWCTTLEDKHRSRSDSIILSKLNKCDPAQNLFRTTGRVDDAMILTDLKHIEKYQVSSSETVQRVVESLKPFSKPGSITNNSCLQGTADIYFLKPDDVHDSYHFSKDISTPILFRTILASDGEKGEKRLALKIPFPDARSTGLHTDTLFHSLSEFRRSLFTSEKSLWSRASKDVLYRAKYKRRRLLSPRQIASLILSARECPVKPITASSVGTACKVLDALVFSRLRALFAFPREGKSRTTTLLDTLDFVPAQVAKSRQRFLTTSCQRVMRMQHKYDSPTRKWSQVHFEKILTRYESKKAHSEEASESQILMHSPLEDNDIDSDASMLDDFVLSGEELEWQSDGAHGLGILEEIREDLQHHGNLKTTTQPCDADVQRKERSHPPDPRRSRGKKLKVRLKVPDTLVCAPWVIQAAEQCLQSMPRGCIFLPPPLSVLPIVAILTNTHLRGSVRDQRVAIVCETQIGVTDYIREYLQTSLGKSVSVDSIKRSDDKGIGVVPLPCTTARVVVLDSFLFSFTVNFSLLIVVVSSVEDSVGNVHSRDQVFMADDTHWVRIPSVFFAPLDTCVGLQTYFKAVRHLSERLRAEDILWVTANDDVYDSIAVATPRVVYLAPSQQASRLVSLLDAEAAPYLEVYMSVKTPRSSQPKNRSSGLQGVCLRSVRKIMEHTSSSDDSRHRGKLELLHILRQARSFAIYDGFAIAIAYLQHCVKQEGGQVRRVLKSILDDLEDEITSTTHPVVKALTTCLKEAEHRMLKDPPSLRSIHRRDRFRPLIVANSQEAVNGCLQCLKDAVILSEASDGSIAVCSLQQLNLESKNSSAGQLPAKLEEISHVFHVVDDRYDIPSDLLLPTTVLQHIHAGRTRLITIAVDETRELDGQWDREVSWYDELSRNLGKEEVADIAYEGPYLQQLSFESFWSVATHTFPEWEGLANEVVQAVEPSGYNMSMICQTWPNQRDPGTLHLSSHEVCSSRAETLREMLNKLVKDLPNECPTLRVFICIQPGESCTPAVTYVHSALAGSERLRQQVLVQTLFIF